MNQAISIICRPAGIFKSKQKTPQRHVDGRPYIRSRTHIYVHAVYAHPTARFGVGLVSLVSFLVFLSLLQLLRNSSATPVSLAKLANVVGGGPGTVHRR